MKETIVLDGIRTKLEERDLDGDGRVGGVETLHTSGPIDTQNIVQPTELGEAIKELNNDQIEQDTRMSGIDMRSRLFPSEVKSLLGADGLVALGVLPSAMLSFTRQKKRLSVSLMGKGREEIRDITVGERAHQKESGGMLGWAKEKLVGK